MYNVIFFLSHWVRLLFGVPHGLGKQLRVWWGHSDIFATDEVVPFRRVEFRWHLVGDNAWNLLLETLICLWEHQLEQDFVSFLVFEKLRNIRSTQFCLKSFIIRSVPPIIADTFTKNTGWEFFFCKRFEFNKHKLRNMFQLNLAKDLEDLLDKVVPVLILYHFLCIKIQSFYQYLLQLKYFVCLRLVSYGMEDHFQDAHWVFVIDEFKKVRKYVRDYNLCVKEGKHRYKLP